MRWVAGIAGAGVACGIKGGGGLDLGLLVAERPSRWAGTFTNNGAPAPSVAWSRSLLGRPLRAVVVNSGNANACTGPSGENAVRQTTAAVAGAVGCSREEVAVCSTGPIGFRLPIEKLTARIPEAVDVLGPELDPFARAILTTDTVTKVASASAGPARVIGVAKGAAMVAPSMATMLAFLATDARADDGTLREILSTAVSRSFNRISVDACESTNDSVFLISTGRGPAVGAEELFSGVVAVCSRLAEQIVRDAEGAKRMMRIRVSGAADEHTAVRLGRAVAASALWRAAAYGADPNWGRVVAALGAADRSLDLPSLEISIGSEVVLARGEPAGSLEAAAKEMDASEFTLACVVGSGPGAAEVLSADLSGQYVELNARGTT